jgi:hypothetical protein
MREKVVENCEQEGCGLAGAGLGLARDILPGESDRQRLCLNFCAELESCVIKTCQQPSIEFEVGESGLGEITDIFHKLLKRFLFGFGRSPGNHCRNR